MSAKHSYSNDEHQHVLSIQALLSPGLSDSYYFVQDYKSHLVIDILIQIKSFEAFGSIHYWSSFPDKFLKALMISQKIGVI